MNEDKPSLEHLKARADTLPPDPELALEHLVHTDFFKQLDDLPAIQQSLVLHRLKKRTGISVSEARRYLKYVSIGAEATRLRDMVLTQWDEIGQQFRYVTAWQTWFRYEAGVYKKTFEETLLKHVTTLLENAGYRPSERILRDVLAKLSRADGVILEHPPPSSPLLNVQNGLLDLERLELLPHAPETMTFAQAPVEFRSDAVAHNFQAFLRHALPNEIHRLTLQEFMGYVLTPYTFLQRALYLKGPGGTGKGTLLAAMQRLLAGGEYGLSCSLSIEDLGDGSPSLVNAVGKRLIYISEVPARANLIGFKKIVGEDRVVINPKYKRPFDSQLEAKIIITGNEFIHMGNDSANNSVDRRLILLPFNVRPTKTEYNPRLLAELTTSDELSGILAWAIEGWQRLKVNDYHFSSYGDEVERLEFLSNSNPVLLFVQECCTVDQCEETRTSELFEVWRVWCEGDGVEVTKGKRGADGQEKMRWSKRGGKGYRVGSVISFSKRLEETLRILGWQVQKVRKEKGTTWVGLAINTSTDS